MPEKSKLFPLNFANIFSIFAMDFGYCRGTIGTEHIAHGPGHLFRVGGTAAQP
jgi:hypothetical protein